VIDMLFHTPVILGRQFATLDVLSQGRCICGLGIGWSKDEYVTSNVPFENRGARADEFIQALTRIWTDDIVEFKGRYYNIPASKMGPKPIQKPHIPIYLGRFTQRTYSRIAKYVDGWLPTASGSLGYLENGIKTLKEKEKGKKENTPFGVITLISPEVNESKEEGAQRSLFSGTINDVGNDLRKIQGMGVNHVILGLMEPNLDRVIEFIR
jgi:alkanesulfonate monooxygenase SsuD/methylene tetrahydromethanopterin reductase-like flavin-dependent oxidoreductase (luciferase family)